MENNRLLSSIKYLIIFLCVLGLLPSGVARADSTENIIPPGFTLIDSTYGIEMYRKDYSGGSPDFVQLINLSQGAKVIPMHGEIRDPGAGKGVFGGNDARFALRTMDQYWQSLANAEASAYCVTNGQFFLMGETPTRLPFPLKKDGEFLTDGYGKNEFVDRKLMLEIWDGKADIRPLTQAAFYSSTAPHIISGLAEDANKRAAKYVGRTFVGVDDRDLNHEYETILILVTKSTRQVDAAEVLRNFGADKVMMLDGGGSAQLSCEGKAFVSSDRPIPQALGVIAGNESASQKASGLAASLELSVTNNPSDSATSAVEAEAASTLSANTNHESTQTQISQVNLPQPVLRMEDLLWIPSLMMPVVGVLVLVVARMRRAFQR
jgi:hypothetical protein